MRVKKSYYFLAVLLPLFALLHQHAFVFEPFRAVSLTLLRPLLIAEQSLVSAANAGRDQWIGFWTAVRERERLRAELTELQSRVADYEEIKRENERLKGLLKFRDDAYPKATAAKIIGRDPVAWRETVLLDKGGEHHIRKDMAVVVAEGLVGRVLEQGPFVSRALLLTDPDARVSALTSESRAQGVVAGDGSTTLKMTYLELESGAAVGQTVLTSGMGGLFPKGIMIGKIISLERDADGLHLVAKVEPAVHFSKLEEVLCIGSSRSA